MIVLLVRVINILYLKKNNMNKKLLLILSLGALSNINAQKSSKVQNQITKNQNYLEQRFDRYIQKNANNSGKVNYSDLKSRLAAFAGKIPVYNQTDDNRANISANVLPLQNGSLPGLDGVAIEGVGMNILVMDGGKIFEKHREFGADALGVVETQRIFDKEAEPTSYSSHATNVGGIIGAKGVGNFGAPFGLSAAKGVLPKVDIDSYSFATTQLGNNYTKLNSAVTANISNHSYGINLGWSYRTSPEKGYYWVGNLDLNNQDTYSGSYYQNDQFYDLIVYANPNHIVVKSAGNYFGDGPNGVLPNFKFDNITETYIPFAPTDVLPPENCSQGYNCIGWGSLAKNIIVVGASEQLASADNLYTSSADVVKSSYSSAGPRKDGAIKPDISAVGSNHVVAGYTTSTKYNSYSAGNGTSYSAPVVSGVAGALTQITRNLTSDQSFVYKADEMKVLLTHTANEAGNPGPDIWFGWGFVDATNGAKLIMDKIGGYAIFERNLKQSGVVYSKEVFGKEGEQLKATISWIDPAAEPFQTDQDLQSNNASRLINDFDLRIVDTTDNTVFFPWKLDIANPMANAIKGDNTVDNIEQVVLDNPVKGRKYRIEVSNKGTLVNDGGIATPQNYALIVTGLGEEINMSTAVADILKTIAVYPTKTKDNINVVVPMQGKKSITIYDMSGKTVLSFDAKPVQTIDLRKLQNGIYLINIQTENGVISKKVIKE